MTEPRIIVHGGAWTIPADRQKAHVDGCRAAVDAVWGELQRGMPALEAVLSTTIIRSALQPKKGELAADAAAGMDLTLAGR